MYTNTTHQRGVSPYPPGPGIAGSTSNIHLQSQSQSPYNPYLTTPAHASTSTSTYDIDPSSSSTNPRGISGWRRLDAVQPLSGMNMASGSGMTGIKPVFWNQSMSGSSSVERAPRRMQSDRGKMGEMDMVQERTQIDQGIMTGTEAGQIGSMNEVAMDVDNLRQTLLELISLLRSLQQPSSSLPNPDLLGRISKLSSIINTGLSSLSSRTYLDITSLDIPGPSTSVRPETPPLAIISEKGTGKGKASEPSQVEREMDIIRRRRDILIARAKESGKVGGSVAGQKDRNKKEGTTEEVWQAAISPGGDGGDGRMRTAIPNGYYGLTGLEEPVQRPASTSSWMSHTRDHQQPMAYFNTPNPQQQYSSPFVQTPIPNSAMNPLGGSHLDQFFSPPQEIPNNPTTSFPFFPDDPINLDLPLLKLQLAKSEALALAMHGRCHSCSVVVEGEWMEGPDGPNSLCLSCGPHYARLKQKKKGDEVDEGFKMTPEQRLNMALGITSLESGIANTGT